MRFSRRGGGLCAFRLFWDLSLRVDGLNGGCFYLSVGGPFFQGCFFRGGKFFFFDFVVVFLG